TSTKSLVRSSDPRYYSCCRMPFRAPGTPAPPPSTRTITCGMPRMYASPTTELISMQQLKQTEPTADILGPIIGVLMALVTLGCGGCGFRTAVSDGDDAQGTPDLPASPSDLPVEPSEYEGIVVGINYHALPSWFLACDTGEIWEMTSDHAPPGWRVEGSCVGVFKRVRGQLDRSVDPPVVIIEETLEARWAEPGDCV